MVSTISNGASSIASESDVAERIARFDANARRLEGIGVRPLDGVRRTFGVVAHQRVVHVEPDRSERDLRRMGDLRDDAHRARQPGAAERRRDAHRQQRLLGSPAAWTVAGPDVRDPSQERRSDQAGDEQRARC